METIIYLLLFTIKAVSLTDNFKLLGWFVSYYINLLYILER